MIVNKILFVGIGIIICAFAAAQSTDFSYKREIKDIRSQWHTIQLPDDVFSKIRHDLADIRIYGTGKNGDTSEAPYILRVLPGDPSRQQIPFNIINRTSDAKGYYFTLQLPQKAIINEIKLDLNDKNFDWLVKLEGSNDQSNWFTIAENYRILAINNNLANYRFTMLSFPDASYSFFRIHINSKTRPELASASIFNTRKSNLPLKTITPKNVNITENKQLRQTGITIMLGRPVPVSSIALSIRNNFDYYRPIDISYAADSVVKDKSTRYVYRTISNRILSSLEKQEFAFDPVITNRLKVTIQNGDNQPLQIDSASVFGKIYQLTARFNDDADYYLFYGNPSAVSPDYDIKVFAQNIPGGAPEATLGEEQKNMQDTEWRSDSTIWMWVVIGISILLLGWFTIKLMRKSSDSVL